MTSHFKSILNLKCDDKTGEKNKNTVIMKFLIFYIVPVVILLSNSKIRYFINLTTMSRKVILKY